MTNLGLATANNIMGSVAAKNVTFSNFESQPFLANHFTANGSILGKGFFEIGTMPPRSETNVTTTLNASTADKNEPMLVYLRSDERTGFHDTLITSIFYLGLGVTYVMLFIYLVYWNVVAGKYAMKRDPKTGKDVLKWKKLDQRPLWKIAVMVVIIAEAEILISVIYSYLYSSIPPKLLGVTILVVTATILIYVLIYASVRYLKKVPEAPKEPIKKHRESGYTPLED